jgi:hypothetical protein
VPSLLLPYWICSEDERPRLALTPARLQTKEGGKEGQVSRVSPLAVLPHLLRGYRAAARALISIRERLLASGGWLELLNRFHAPRVVVRPTLAYALLVSRSLAPDCLEAADARRSTIDEGLKDGCQDELKYELRSSRTLRAGDGITQDGISQDRIWQEMREAEADALMALDMPRFIVPAGTRALALSSGRVVVPQLLGSTPAESIRCRLEALCEESVASVQVPALTMACLAAASSHGISSERVNNRMTQ